MNKMSNEQEKRFYQIEVLWLSVSKYLVHLEKKHEYLMYYGTMNCPCCINWHTLSGCDGCPIKQDTGEDYCIDTPYTPMSQAMFKYKTEKGSFDFVEEEYTYLVELALKLSDKYRSEYAE